jgi:hypothetical protein
LLIKIKKFDKKLDEFNTADCAICFEAFVEGVEVRKLPICHHLFHSTCIEGWFKAKINEATHKCPLCNDEVTVEKV